MDAKAVAVKGADGRALSIVLQGVRGIAAEPAVSLHLKATGRDHTVALGPNHRRYDARGNQGLKQLKATKGPSHPFPLQELHRPTRQPSAEMLDRQVNRRPVDQRVAGTLPALSTRGNPRESLDLS